MADNKTVFTVVALPFALWALQRAIESTLKFRQTVRSRYLDTTQLLDDIETNLKETKNRLDVLEAELAGSPCPMEDKTTREKDYVVFTVSSDVTFEVFQSDAVQRFSHLESALFTKLKRFYDLQKLIAATYKSAASDLFKGLSSARKVQVLRSLLDLSRKGQTVGSDCIEELRLEIGQINRSFLWKVLFLTHARSRRVRARSAEAATLRSPLQSMPASSGNRQNTASAPEYKSFLNEAQSKTSANGTN